WCTTILESARALVLGLCPCMCLRLALGGVVPAGRALGPYRLQLLQAVLHLERAHRSLGAAEVVVHRRLRAVLTHKVYGQVDVIVAVRRDTVTDGDPPARCLRALIVVEPHRAHEVVRDRDPLLVRQRAL